MNWREHPQLFANGKFRIKNDYGYNALLTASELGMQLMRDKSKHNLVGLKDKKLIARPISDMSDEEIASWEKVKHPIEYDYGNDSALIESPKSFMYLIAIGVLPREFDDTDVMWRYEND